MRTATKCTHVNRWTHIGTVSHGTLRNEDLIDALFPVLEELDPKSAEELHQRYDDAIGDDTEREDGADDCVAELMDCLSANCPAGIYFGANEGDGSDFGFWFCDSEDVRHVPNLPNKPEKDESEIFLVSDHGNVTLYAWCSTHGWQEVYGIV